MQALTSFFQHYLATYDAYLHSAIIYQVMFIYVIFMATAIYFMAKYNKFQYFFHVLMIALIPSSAVYTWTFWSLW